MGGGLGYFACGGCGKQYKWREEIAGKQARCSCGQVMRVPNDEPGWGAEEAEVREEAAVAAAPVAKKKSGGGGELPLDVRLAAEKARRRAETERREREEDEASVGGPSLVRDWVIPPVLLGVGIVLLFVEVMKTGKNPAASVGAAMPLVGMGVALKAGLMVGGIFLAVAAFDVTLVGGRLCSVLKLGAIAIGPAAVKGLLVHSIGDLLYGSLAGVFVSIAIYVALFKGLMKTDTRDTAICVVMTWILVTMAEYLAYKWDSYARDTWI